MSYLAGGLWIIPLVTLIGALIFLYQAYKASKSNSTRQLRDGSGKTLDNTGDVPIYKVPRFYFSVALFVATIVIFLMMRSDR